jgi:serine protease inhibitor
MKDSDMIQIVGEIAPEYIDSAAGIKRRRPLRAILTAAASLLVTAGMVFGVCTALKKQEEKAAHAEPTAVATEAAEPTPAEETEDPNAWAEYYGLDPNATRAPETDMQRELREAAAAAAEIPAVPVSVLSNDYFDYYRDLRIEAMSLIEGVEGFYSRTIPTFLLAGEKDENAAYSPFSVYMALAMMAETAGGETRAQVLDLLGAESIEELRDRANKLFLLNYFDNDVMISRPAASVWVNRRFGGVLKAGALEKLASEHHASVYEGDMESPEFISLFRDWMNESTGGLLEDQINDMEFSPAEMMRIVSTIYFKTCWMDKFYEENSEGGVFHSPTGDETVTFMHGGGNVYYDCEGCTMVNKNLIENANVYFVLPDEGVSLGELIAEGRVFNDILSGAEEYVVPGAIIHLNLPKFDVESRLDLKEGLMKLGVTDIFTEDADLTPLTDIDGAYVSSVSHGVRVTVDEEGVSAAAYTMIPYCGAMPPTLEVDFTLDRPFMFVVTSMQNIPLFVGTVYHPAG